MHLSAILAILGSASVASAHPAKRDTSISPRGLANLDAFRMPLLSNYTSAEKIIAKRENTASANSDDALEVAKAHVKDKNPDATFRLVDDHYVGSNGITHVRFKQTIHDIDIDNADYTVNIDKDGKVFSYGGSFYSGETPAKPTLEKRNTEEALDAVKLVSAVLGLPVSLASAIANAAADAMGFFVITGAEGVAADPRAKKVYFMTGDGKLKLVWRVETDITDNWLQSYVDPETNDIHGVVDWVSDATYEVFPFGLDSPDDGNRTVVTDPWDDKASEFTWIGDGKTKFTTTRGNNGIAQSNPNGGGDYEKNKRPDSPDAAFEYDYSTDMSDPKSYEDASITQLFYTANKCHDLFYLLGFNEAAGNFEINNNGQGGKGNDFVVLNAQDGSGKNNANFATPPDGQAARMRMYIWDMTSPPRDASFDAGVIIHEYTHGVSTRLTGGPSNSGCLSATESGGMGEGWGDLMGVAIRLRPSDTRDKDFPVGSWVSGKPNGIRQYPYSTSLETNPLGYEDLQDIKQVHGIGTVWASMLYEVLWNLVDKYPAQESETPEFDGDGVPTDGRFLTMKLLMDAMALQPCNPSFVQARDAILDADRALTGGENACEIWKGFAKRGLGDDAADWWILGRWGSDQVPPGVC